MQKGLTGHVVVCPGAPVKEVSRVLPMNPADLPQFFSVGS